MCPYIIYYVCIMISVHWKCVGAVETCLATSKNVKIIHFHWTRLGLLCSILVYSLAGHFYIQCTCIIYIVYCTNFKCSVHKCRCIYVYTMTMYTTQCVVHISSAYITIVFHYFYVYIFLCLYLSVVVVVMYFKRLHFLTHHILLMLIILLLEHSTTGWMHCLLHLLQFRLYTL